MRLYVKEHDAVVTWNANWCIRSRAFLVSTIATLPSIRNTFGRREAFLGTAGWL